MAVRIVAGVASRIQRFAVKIGWMANASTWGAAKGRGRDQTRSGGFRLGCQRRERFRRRPGRPSLYQRGAGTKAAPAVDAAYGWSGFYVGNGGGARSRTCWDVNPFTINVLTPPVTVSGREGCKTASGAAAGGQIGYRWQRSAFLFGLEAQGNWADLTGSNASR
jgi:hypothetical protein